MVVYCLGDMVAGVPQGKDIGDPVRTGDHFRGRTTWMGCLGEGRIGRDYLWGDMTGSYGVYDRDLYLSCHLGEVGRGGMNRGRCWETRQLWCWSWVIGDVWSWG